MYQHQEKRINYRNFLGLLICIVFFVTMAVVKAEYDSRYRNYCHELQLENVICPVPISMWDAVNDNILIDDNMFLIRDNDQNYYIFGVQLEKLDKIDEPEFYKIFDRNEIKVFEGMEDLKKIIQQSCNALGTITDSRIIEYSDETKFLIDGEGGGEYEGYETFVVAQKKEDVSYLEIVLYRKPALLHAYERKDMYRKVRII